jgi:hypothetical protein
MISESSVSRLSIGLNLFDSVVECLNGLVRVPVCIKAFGVGSEVDGCDATVFVKEVLDEDMDGDMFVSGVVVMVGFSVDFFDGLRKLFL